MSVPKHVKAKNGQDGALLFMLCAIAVYAIDQVCKAMVFTNMMLYESIPLIPGFFHLTFIMNSGASFGILKDWTYLFIATSSAVVLFIVWIVFFWKGIDRASKILMGFIAGGALGNLTDRLRFGAVVDFLDFRGIWSYIFNTADIAVVCGGFMLALLILFDEWQAGNIKPRH